MPKLLGREVKTNREGKPVIDEATADKLTTDILSFALSDLSSIAKANRVQKDWKKILDKEFPIHLVHRTFPSLKIMMAKRLGGGGTNTTTFIQTSTDLLVGRCPGKDSDKFLNRPAESKNIKIAHRLGISPAVMYDDEKGILLTKYLKNPKTMSTGLFKKPDLLDKSIKTLKKIHESGERFANDIDVFERNDRMLAILEKRDYKLPDEFKDMKTEIEELKKLFNSLKIKKVPCHVDTCPGNFVESEGEIKLIDWEYSGNNDPIWDLVYLSIEAEFTPEQDRQMFESYFGSHFDKEAMQRFILYKPVYNFWAILWASVQLANENFVCGSKLLNEIVVYRLQEYKKSISNPEFQEIFLFLHAQILAQQTLKM